MYLQEAKKGQRLVTHKYETCWLIDLIYYFVKIVQLKSVAACTHRVVIVIEKNCNTDIYGILFTHEEVLFQTAPAIFYKALWLH